jgi:hypothetical protein
MASERVEAVIVVLVLVGIGVPIVLGFGIFAGTYHLALSDPEPVEATILASGVTEKHDDDDTPHSVPFVRYEYTYVDEEARTHDYVDGTERSSNIYAGEGPATLPTYDAAKAVADRFEKGDTVTAYVWTSEILNGNTMERSYLIGSSPRIYVYYGMVLFGFWLIWAGFGMAMYQVFGIDLPGRARHKR